MTPTEEEIAAVVIHRAKSAQHDGRSAYWLWPDLEEITRIHGTGQNWAATWAQSKHIVYLE